MKKLLLIIIASIAACLLLFVLEQVLIVNYIVKTSFKIGFFAVLPIIFLIYFKEKIKLSFTRKETFIGLGLGLLTFGIVLVAYYIFRPYIDTDSIIAELNEKQITASNFILIGLYITFGNSFLEEFFFRGFLFWKIYESGRKKFAYIFSAGLFSIYHIAIFQTWFSLGITLLALIGLFSVGIIFNLINSKSKTFLNSWGIHICADAAIILIGLNLFGILPL